MSYLICEQQRRRSDCARSLISAFVVRCLDGIISLDSIAERTCCNLAGFVPTTDLDKTSMEGS